MLDVQILLMNAGWHHSMNLLLHAANAILLLLVLSEMTGALAKSAIVAALFAIHPLHVESVAWIAERKDVLSTFFGLLCLGAYIRFVELSGKTTRAESGKPQVSERSPRTEVPRANRYYFVSLVFFALGLMSKAMVATIPFVLLLLDYWPLGRLRISVQNFESLAPSSGLTPSARGLELRTLRQLVREKAQFFLLAILSVITAFLI